MKKTKKNNLIKKIAILAIFLIIAINISRVIYATIIEKTSIVCTDEKMYDALNKALKTYVLEEDKNNLTLKIATEDIPKITSINLDNSGITNITGIEKLTSLTSISLIKNQITDVTKISELQNITELYLNENENLGNSIKQTELASRTKIVKLGLANTGLSDISFLSNFNALQELNISNGSFPSINAIRNLINITKLDISYNQSIRDMDVLLNLTKLKVLNISNTGISRLELDSENNIGIYNLQNLEELYVSNLNVENIEPIVKSYYHEIESGENIESAYLENLKILDISYVNKNETIYIPSFERFSLLKNLKKLYMQGNNMNSMEQLYKLQGLEEINLEDNKITSFSGIAEIETQYNDDGSSYEIIKTISTVTKMDLSSNEIGTYQTDLDVLGKTNAEMVNFKNALTFLDLSQNHIYDTRNLENVGGTLKLQNQTINLNIYKKIANTDQYIILYPIFQGIKDNNSKLYSSNATIVTNGCTLNTDPEYQDVNMLNVIILNSKTEEDSISARISGSIADGTQVTFSITQDSNAVDSILFKDENLNSAVSNELRKNPNATHRVHAKKILNINHFVITDTRNLDLQNKNIADISGLENFDGLYNLNIAENKQIQSIDVLRYCTEMQVLNASGTSIGNNYSVINEMDNLKGLLLNSVGMTNINCINNRTQLKLDNNEETTIEELDLSANSLNDLNGVEKITTLKILTATKNNISELPDLSSLTQLEKLTMYTNKLTKMPKIDGTEKKLKNIFLSENLIDDISELQKLTNIVELDLSNNKLTDENIETLRNLRVSKNLKLAGNRITDISSLSLAIQEVSEIDLSNNMIKDVSLIDNAIKNENGKMTAWLNNQKIAIALESTSDTEISIDLPQICIAAKNNGGYFYTEDELEAKNCTISQNKMNINLQELGNKAATVTIVGGKAGNSVVSVVAPIMAQVSYSTTEWTKEDVVATITFTNREDVTINNNEGKNTYTFSENGEFTFEYTDSYGMQGTTKATVSWIDKELPKVTGVENNKTYNEAVTPIITDNRGIKSIKLTKDGENVENFTSGTKIEEYGQYVLTVSDDVGNQTTISFKLEEKSPDIPAEEKLESSLYNVNYEKKILNKVAIGTTVKSLKENISGVTSYKIQNSTGNDLSDDDVITTNSKIVINNEEVYTIVVNGDLNSNGQVDLNDIGQAQKIFLEIDSNPGDVRFLATDVNYNNKIDLNDIAQIQNKFLSNN